MLTLLVITFDRKIKLMQGLWHWKLDFKSFPTVYYMSNSDNWARNGDHLNSLQFFSTKRWLGFCGKKAAAESAIGSEKYVCVFIKSRLGFPIEVLHRRLGFFPWRAVVTFFLAVFINWVSFFFVSGSFCP